MCYIISSKWRQDNINKRYKNENKMIESKKTIIHIIIASLILIISFMFIYNHVYADASGTSLANIAVKENNSPGGNYIQNSSTAQKQIYIDLQNMTVSLQDGEKIIKTFNIVTKGKPGSYYQTPAGNYTVQLKEEKHYSSLGHVYMPYSMQFFGNFFIHGIPYYADGTRVTSSYSGGCIRMLDADAIEIYTFADMGTKIKIKNSDEQSEYNDIGKEMSKNILIAMVSLEFMNQEKIVNYKNTNLQVKELIPSLISGDANAIQIVKNSLGAERLNSLISEKSYAIGINPNLDSAADRVKLYNYIINNKSYLLHFI